MAIHKKGPGPARLARWRIWIQSVFALIWLDGLSNFVRMHSFCSPVFHCYSCPWASFACPIGVIANFSALHMFPFIAVGTLVAVGRGLFRRGCFRDAAGRAQPDRALVQQV